MGLGRKTKDARRNSEKRKLESEGSNLMTCGPLTTRKRQVPDDADLMTSDPSSSKRRRLVPPPANPNLMTCGSSTINNFEVIPIMGDGNCLFRAISHCLFGTEDRHHEVRLTAIDHIAKNWRAFKNFIVGDETYGQSIKNATDYKRVMSANGQYAGHAELQSVSELFPNCLFRVYQENGDIIANYGSGGTIHDLLFSGNPDNGHYSVLNDSSRTPMRETLDISSVVVDPDIKRTKGKATLTGRREAKAKAQKERESRVCRSSKKFRFASRCAVSDATPDVSPYSVGGLEGVCQYCSALYFKPEKNTAGKFTLCCYDGKIKLPPSTTLEEMKELFSGNNERSKNFRDNIRQYNNAMSFVSFGAKVDYHLTMVLIPLESMAWFITEFLHYILMIHKVLHMVSYIFLILPKLMK